MQQNRSENSEVNTLNLQSNTKQKKDKIMDDEQFNKMFNQDTQNISEFQQDDDHREI